MHKNKDSSTSAHQHISTSAHQHITLSPCHLVTPSPYHLVTLSPLHPLTPSSPHSILLLFILTLLLTTACQPTDTSWEEIAERGEIRVGLDPTYPPFEFHNGETLQGIDVELANALADELGVTAVFTLFGYDGLYDALGTEQVDVLISAMVIVPERTRDFAYSDPYFNAGELLIVPTDETEIEEMRDLDGRSLAVELGAQGHVEATVWQNNLGDLTILPQETGDVALTAVLSGEADAALVDAITARLFLGMNDGLTAVSTPITTDPFAIVTRAEDEQLLTEINRALATLEADGTLDAILQKWFTP